MLSRATSKPRSGAYCILIQQAQRSLAHNPSSTDDLALVPEARRSGVQASYRKGTQGRSSFSGIVATVFGGAGFLGSHVVNRLGKVGTQLIIPYRGDPYHARHLKLAGDLGQVLFTQFWLKDEQSVRKAMLHSNTVINMMGNIFPTRSVFIRQVALWACGPQTKGPKMHLTAIGTTFKYICSLAYPAARAAPNE